MKGYRDIADAIVERGLVPIECTSVYKTQCIGCEIPEDEDIDGPFWRGAYIAYNGRSFVVYWPHVWWEADVASYVSALLDSCNTGGMPQ